MSTATVVACSALILFLAALAIVVLESGDFLWFWRFCAPLWPIAVVLTVLGVDALTRKGTGYQITAALASSLSATAVLATAFDGDLAMRAAVLADDNRALTAFSRVLRDGFRAADSIAVGPLGRFVYYARPGAAWDVWGLVVPEIARGTRVKGAKVGHERRGSEAILARRPTFVFWELRWRQDIPCDKVDARGHARDLGADFAAFEGHDDYVVAYVRHPHKALYAGLLVHPHKALYAGLLVRADALLVERALRVSPLRDACRRN
jgi:hypothetical protein